MFLALPAPPDVELTDAIRSAADHGLALELRASRDPRVAVATNLLFTDPAKVRRLLDTAGVPLTAVSMTVPTTSPPVVVDELARAAIATAAAGGAVVRLLESIPTSPAVLRSAARAAAAVGVRLALVNRPVRNGVADLWRRLDAVAHPALGCSLDTAHAAAGGDGPSLSVPTLGGRIVHVRLAHPPTDADAVHRLAGVGYTGPLSIPTPASAATIRPWLPPAPTARPRLSSV